MALSAGDKLGPYEILAKIGAGGMGEVYRAHDPRLRRAMIWSPDWYSRSWLVRDHIGRCPPP